MKINKLLCKSIIPQILMLFILANGCNRPGGVNSEPATASDVTSPLKPYEENPKYWEYHGQPVLLLGGSKNDNLFQSAGLGAHLDSMHLIGANYVRNTMSSRDSGDAWWFKKLENGKYDLSEFNSEYWTKFEQFLQMTYDRSIIVQIEVWDRFDFSVDFWQDNPFNPKNNINYSVNDTPFDTAYPAHPSADIQPFFHTVPEMEKYNPAFDDIRSYQENIVGKLLEISLQYDHVLYCINNETTTSPLWGKYWINFINSQAANAGKEVYVTDMYDHFYQPQQCEDCKNLIAAPETFEFIDCSQINSRNMGQNHWDTLQWIVQERNNYPLRPINCTKVYGGGFSSWNSGSNQNGVERFCRNIFGGTASARHHRPHYGCGLNELAKASITAIRNMEKNIKMWEVETAMDLLEDRNENEAYAIALKNQKYGIYFPSGGSVKLNLTDADGKFQMEWISVKTGEFKDQKEWMEAGKKVEISAPDSTGWIATIIR